MVAAPAVLSIRSVMRRSLTDGLLIASNPFKSRFKHDLLQLNAIGGYPQTFLGSFELHLDAAFDGFLPHQPNDLLDRFVELDGRFRNLVALQQARTPRMIAAARLSSVWMSVRISCT